MDPEKLQEVRELARALIAGQTEAQELEQLRRMQEGAGSVHRPTRWQEILWHAQTIGPVLETAALVAIAIRLWLW